MSPRFRLNRAESWPETACETARLRRAARETILTGGSRTGEVSITFVGEEEIRDLNRRFLGRDEPTDVIAFQLGEAGELLGDVYICPPVARRRAAQAEVDAHEEMLRLVVHGILHVLGHDHPEGDDRWESEMFRLQERIVERVAREGE